MPLNLVIAPERVTAAHAIAAVLKPGLRVALTTHVNADGDGVGSEVALWHLLKARGLQPGIANATGIPERFDFLIPDGADQSDRAGKEIARADLVVVIDISDLGRIGDLAGAVRDRRVPVICIDHHVSQGTLPEGPRLVAPAGRVNAALIGP
jgi:phosphoesterase RecJ-like protein